MGYIGTPIDTRNQFQSLQGKRFSGDGSETEFTLDVAPGSVLDIEVFVGNVRQDPNSAYTLSGTTLTFTGAPPSGTNNIYVVHQAKSVGTIGIPDDTISARTLVPADSSADHVIIEDATDGELKKALYPSGFSVSSITGATELAAQPAATDEIILSDAGTLKRLDIKHISNTPAFSVKQSGNQAIANQTDTKVEFGTEVFDSDGVFASHKFTPVIPGKYFLKAQVLIEYGNSSGEYGDLAIYKNGTKVIAARNNKTGDPTRSDSLQVSGIVTADSDDYFEIYLWHNQGASQNTDSNDDYTRFEGFRLTGMES